MTQGIYKLTNNKNDKVYVGQSMDIEQRFKDHMYGLKNKKHHAFKLQNFYNKHKNQKSFKVELEILEIVDNVKNLNAREQYYIKTYNSYHDGFNSTSMNGDEMQTKKKAQQNKRLDKINNSKCEFNMLIDKYKNNLYMQYTGYNDTYLYRVNEAIKYFVNNYNLDLYMAEISQYKHDVTLSIIDKNFAVIQKYEYITKNKCMGICRYTYVHKNSSEREEWSYDRYKKFNNIVKSKNRYKWFLKRLINLDSDIIKYNTLKHSPNKYKIRYRDIHPIIGYEYGSNFKKHITEDSDIKKLSKEIGVTYPHGHIEVYIQP